MDEQLSDGQSHSIGPNINIVPVISADKTSVGLMLQAGIDGPSTRR